jgi:dipeptidyl aminopeptidase/acylaminoacyl peptidase
MLDWHAEGGGPSRFLDLAGPAGSPLVVLLHGGWWRARHDLSLMVPLAEHLIARGWRVANVEFRRIDGDDGGWPTTLEDVLDALDLLTELGEGRPTLVGHSAGGQLALLAATRRDVAGVVALAPVTDLVACAEAGLGEGATPSFVGGSPGEVPDAYRAASPITNLPVRAPVLVVQGDADVRVPAVHAERFVAAARAAGDVVELVSLAGGDHFVVVDPSASVWRQVEAWMTRPGR